MVCPKLEFESNPVTGSRAIGQYRGTERQYEELDGMLSGVINTSDPGPKVTLHFV